jgi:uncharacterized OsmC-like protein
VRLKQQADYCFDIRFDDNMPVLTSDEPAPLGTGLGPSSVQLMCAAVGHCLSDALLFAFRKFKQTPEPIQCEVQAQVGRNEQGRMRVLKMDAKLKLGVAASRLANSFTSISNSDAATAWLISPMRAALVAGIKSPVSKYSLARA